MVATTTMDLRRARAVLGVSAADGPEALRAAFRRGVMANHPDRAGGDAARMREVIEAYGLLKAPPAEHRAAPASAPVAAPSAPQLAITPTQAAFGGEVLVTLAGDRQVKVALPAGLRQGDTVRVDGAPLVVRVGREAGMMLRGDDLWLTAEMPPSAARGGRIALSTPAGPREVWIDRRDMARGVLRLSGHGLPARGPHGTGDLFIQLRVAEPGVSGVRVRLRAFQAAWAPQASAL